MGGLATDNKDDDNDMIIKINDDGVEWKYQQ